MTYKENSNVYLNSSETPCRTGFLRNSGHNRINTMGMGIETRDTRNTINLSENVDLMWENRSVLLGIGQDWVCWTDPHIVNENYIYFLDVTGHGIGQDTLVITEYNIITKGNTQITVNTFDDFSLSSGVLMSFLEDRKILVVPRSYSIEPYWECPIYLLNFETGSSVDYGIVTDPRSLAILMKSNGDLWIYLWSYTYDSEIEEYTGYHFMYRNYTQNTAWEILGYNSEIIGYDDVPNFDFVFLGEDYLVVCNSYYVGGGPPLIVAHSLKLSDNSLITSSPVYGEIGGNSMKLYGSAPDNQNKFAIFTSTDQGFIIYYPETNNISRITDILDPVPFSTKDNAYIISSSTGSLYKVDGMISQGTLPLDSSGVWSSTANLIDEYGPSLWWFDWENLSLKQLAFDGTIMRNISIPAAEWVAGYNSSCMQAGDRIIVNMKIQQPSSYNYGWNHYIIT